MNEVAHATRIREPVLIALEEDRYVNLPPIYVKSFLEAYAESLGLDPSEVMAIHERYAEKLFFSKEHEPKHPPTRSKRANVRLLVISVSVVLLMALIGYALLTLLQ